MRIDLTDDYYVVADKYNWALHHLYVSESEKVSKEKKLDEVVGYYHRLSDLADAIVNTEITSLSSHFRGSIAEYVSFINDVTKGVQMDLLEQLKRYMNDKPDGWLWNGTEDNGELPFCDEE